MDTTEEKRRLRRQMASRRRAIPAAQAQAAARSVARLVAEQPEYRSAARVALYASLPDELPTGPLFERCRGEGKQVLFPRLVAEGLEFAAVEDPAMLQTGRFGVPEPGAARPRVELVAGDLVIVPGVAFDRSGNRLGRGGGSYDRAFPPDLPSPSRFGIAYAFQLVDEVPHGPDDRRVDAVVTEYGVFRRSFQ